MLPETVCWLLLGLPSCLRVAHPPLSMPPPAAPLCAQAACADAWRQFLARFAGQYLPFRAAVHAVAALDCLAGLARVATTPG